MKWSSIFSRRLITRISRIVNAQIRLAVSWRSRRKGFTVDSVSEVVEVSQDGPDDGDEAEQQDEPEHRAFAETVDDREEHGDGDKHQDEIRA